MPPKTQRERDDEARQEKLELIEEQIKAGTLVIRQMTPKERALYKRPSGESPPPPGLQRRKRTRRGPQR